MLRLSSRQFGLYFLTLTVAFAVMIPAIRWLNVVGAGALLVATGAARGWKISNQIGRALLVLAIAIFLANRAQERGKFCGDEPQVIVELAAIFMIWLLSVSFEYRAWLKTPAGQSAT